MIHKGIKFAKIPYGPTITILFLIVAALCLVVGDHGYSREDFGEAYYDVLPKGDYHICVSHGDVLEENAIVVSTEVGTTAENVPGYVIEKVCLNDKERGIAEFDIHLDEDVFDVNVRLESYNNGAVLDYVGIRSIHGVDIDDYLLATMLIFFAVWMYSFCKKHSPKEYLVQFALIGISVVLSVPLFNDYLIFGHDTMFHLARIEGTYRALLSGEFPVRINPIQAMGLGNISSSMYPGLFIYIPVIFRLLGASTIFSYKILISVCNFFTAYFSFLSAKSIYKSEKVGLFVSAIYSLSLYRMSDMILRGALGELLAMTFLPLVLWGCYEVLWRDKKKWIILTLGLTGVVEAHVLSFLICIAFLVLEGIIWLISKMEWKEKLLRIGEVMKAAVMTILINASFLVPFLRFSKEDFNVFAINDSPHRTVAYLANVFSMFPLQSGTNLPWGTVHEEMPISIGNLFIFAVAAFIAFCYAKDKSDNAYVVSKHCFSLGIISVILTLWMFPWKRICDIESLRTVLSSVQFLWRILSVSAALLAFAAGYLLVYFEKTGKGPTTICILFALFLMSSFYAYDTGAFYNPASNDKLIFYGADMYDELYMYTDSVPERNPNCVILKNGGVSAFQNYQKEGNHIHFDMSAPSNSNGVMVYPLYYYPGYHIEYNGIEQKVFEENGFVASMAPTGNAHVDVSYKGFPSFVVADVVSLLTVILLIGYGTLRRKKNEK